MEIKISKIKKLEGKQDKNGNTYYPVVIESPQLMQAHWCNCQPDSPILEWLEGDVVQIDTAERVWQGKTFYSFNVPFKGKKWAGKASNTPNNAPNRPVETFSQKSGQIPSPEANGAIKGDSEVSLLLRQIDAKLTGLRTFLEKELNDLRNEKNPINF